MPRHNLAASGQPETRPLARVLASWPRVRLSISGLTYDFLLHRTPERRGDCRHLLLRLSE
jgi:hypothetical protein